MSAKGKQIMLPGKDQAKKADKENARPARRDSVVGRHGLANDTKTGARSHDRTAARQGKGPPLNA